MELQELINTFYQPLVYKVDMTSTLGTKVEPPNFQREMELILEVSKKEYDQCGEEFCRQAEPALRSNRCVSNLTLTYRNVSDNHLENPLKYIVVSGHCTNTSILQVWNVYGTSEVLCKNVDIFVVTSQ